MNNEIIKFSVTDAAIKELATKYQDMKIIDTASYKLVAAGIGEIRSIRISVENRRLEYGRSLNKLKAGANGEAKRITELLLPIETELKAIKQVEDDKKEAIKAEKAQAEQERIELIRSRIAAFPPDISRLPQLLKMTAPEIREMQDALATIEIDLEVFQEFTPEAIKTRADKTKLLRDYYISRITADTETAKQKAEADRVEQVRKDQEAKEKAFKKEQDRTEAERLAKIEAQRIIDEKTREEQETALRKQEEKQAAKQKIEDDRLNKIRKDQEAEAQKLRNAQAKIDAQAKILQDKQDRLENERLERKRIEEEKLAQAEANRVAQIEAEKQEKAQIEKEAQEKAAREKAATEEKDRQDALRPDREALELYQGTLAVEINRIEIPLMKTLDGKTVLSFIQKVLKKASADIHQKLKEM